MKTTLCAFIFHIAVLLLLMLSRSGSAYEDPTAKASRQQERQFKPQLEAFRHKYREAFPMHLDLYHKPKEHTVLFVYPDNIHHPFRELLQNGLERPAKSQASASTIVEQGS